MSEVNLGNAELILKESVERTLRTANIFLKRSYVMLFSGVLLAFVGIAVFYVTIETPDSVARNLVGNLPPPPPSSSSSSGPTESYRPPEYSISRVEIVAVYLSRAIRPTAMLIFIEAVAWFLLKQYRISVADYKYIFANYLKSENHLIALSAVKNISLRSSKMPVIASILTQNDDIPRLRSGETTESLELSKMVERNPIFDFVRDMATLFSRGEETTDEKPKGHQHAEKPKGHQHTD